MTNEVAATVPLNIVCDLDAHRHPRSLQELAEALDKVLYMKRVVASQFRTDGFGYRLDDAPSVGYYSIANHVEARVYSEESTSILVPVGLGFTISNQIHTIRGSLHYPKVTVCGDHITLLALPITLKGEWPIGENAVYAHAMTITVLHDLL